MLFRRKRESAWAEDAEPEAEAAVAPASAAEKPGWFEQRARRRRRRKVFEEVVGWIVVPAILYLAFLGYRAVGGIPKEIVDFGNELLGVALKSF
ncbi:hypothetical protein ABE438_13195 [Bosea sp. TWI1241]|uniref:hypothetical protein n=1 Tax=Bosea sp. TWI1241 TaxID=3148904 RepID=UPI00320AC5D8